MRHLRKITPTHFIAVVALAFFFAPLALRVAGMTARPFENRRLATFPKASQGWDALDQGTRFFVDRLPLREQAVHADAWISTKVFDTDPAAGRAGPRAAAGLPAKVPAQDPDGVAPAPVDKAVTGKAGWLFLEGELVRACTPFISWPVAMQRWQKMASIIRRSGRRVLVVIPPDKSTIHPEYLPGAFAQRECLGPGHRAAWLAIEGARDPAILGLRKTMLAVRRPPPDEAYYRQDTHWNRKGGTIAVQDVLERLGGRVRMRPDEIVKGRAEYHGDLSSLKGTGEIDVSPVWSIKRRPGAAQIPGKTLFVYDSFGNSMQDALAPYPRSLELLPWYNTAPGAIIAAIARSDTVLLQTVERELNYKASDQGVITPAFLEELERALRVTAGSGTRAP